MGMFKPWMSNNCDRAVKAIEKLTDQTKLVEAALKAPLESARRAAIIKLTDQGVIARVAATDASIDVRKDAISVCTDDLFMARFACAINHETLALRAIERISSEQMLELVAELTKDRDVRVAAATRIEGEAALVRVAAKMPEYGAWKILDKIAKFPDSAEQFRTLAASAKDPKVRSDVRIRYAKASGDPNLLLACAREESGSLQKSMILGIDDQTALEKAVLVDEDADWRALVLWCSVKKLSDPALMSFALREDNDVHKRAVAASELLQRDFLKNVEALSSVLDEHLRNSHDLIYLLAKNGDPRAITPLEELALRREQGDKMTAPYALGNIQTKEAVKALLHIMEKDHVAAPYAQRALMQLYREARDGGVQNAIAEIPRRVYHEHADVGDHGRSCHEDEPYVHFDVDGNRQ